MAVLTVDLGGTKTLVAAVASDGAITHRFQEQTPKSLDEIVSLLSELAQRAIRMSPEKIEGIGLAVAGLVDQRTGLIISTPNLSLTGIDIGEIITTKVGLPVFVDNDGNLAALGERVMGAAKGMNDFIGLTLGTGIGGGIFIDGQLFHGHYGTGAEIGHMVIFANGWRCACGRLGCFEAMASGTAINRMAREVVERRPRSALAERSRESAVEVTSFDVVELAREGDADSLGIIQSVAQYLGIGLGNLINIFAPEAIILGGGLAGAADLFMPTAQPVALKTAIDPRAASVQFKVSDLGYDAGIYGAAALAGLDFSAKAG